MRSIWILGLLGVAAVFAAAVWFRMAPMPAEAWHVEPADVTPPTSPNHDLRVGARAPVFDAPPEVIAVRLDAVATAERADIIGGDPMSGHVTYVARSALMGFPDAISVRLVPVPGGTRVEMFSRSRFGYSDMGVNAARLDRWIVAIRAQSGS
jgi:uncharacterized protein (DUF1499 family)